MTANEEAAWRYVRALAWLDKAEQALSAVSRIMLGYDDHHSLGAATEEITAAKRDYESALRDVRRS
jgi:hypothetical protein